MDANNKSSINLDRTFRVGVRPSELAVHQGHLVCRALQSRFAGFKYELVKISTTGDFARDRLAKRPNDKREWIKEIEEQLIDQKIDFAVHSGKDVPVDCDPLTTVVPVLEREDSRDVFFGRLDRDSAGRNRIGFAGLPKGATVGTSSLRRRAQLLRVRPDLNVVELRGNVPTRLNKLNEQSALVAPLDGIILAHAGVLRLGLHAGCEILETSMFCPAACQGTLVAQALRDNSEICELLKCVTDAKTIAVWTAERECVSALGADCHSCLGVFAQTSGTEINIRGIALSAYGEKIVEAEIIGIDPIRTARELADKMIALDAKAILFE